MIRMSCWMVVALGLALMLAGCGTQQEQVRADQQAPAPPLTSPDAHAAPYTVTLPTWSVGARLVFTAEVYAEGTSGAGIGKGVNRWTEGFEAVERQGDRVRVRYAVASLPPVEFWIAADGSVTLIAAPPSWKRRAQDLLPLLEQQLGKTFSVGERMPITLPTDGLVDPRPSWLGTTVTADGVFAGYRLLEGRRVAEFRSSANNLLQSPASYGPDGTVTRFSLDSVEYFDVATRHRVAIYQTTVMEGTSLQGVPWTVRAVKLSRLDGAQSR